MSQNVGEIDLGLDINQRQFNNQLSGIANNAQRSATSIFGGFGRTIGKVLGVAAVIGFGKSCLELGSNLSEVQNVVDVTFGAMADDVNKFASTAITQFGLSETAAKRYTGTMGAMLKSSGITTSKALEMSKAITGLSADMASFYNLSNEQAFEKIRSGISGETEPLKQLGINMSVANLEAYRMSEGITKAYSAMSQQEQTMLRYNYLLSVTKDAQGDFARTSDSWANQVRILSEQFNALKASIGQGLIAAFTPIIKGLNFVIAKLRVAAGYFKAFMELIFGKQSSGGGGGGVAETANDVAGIGDAASGASDAVGGIGDYADKAGKKASKAAKKAKGALASFDELNQLSISDDSDSGSGSGGSGSGGGTGLENMGGAAQVDLGKVEEGATKLDGLFDSIAKDILKLKDLFATGFKIGLGDDFIKKVNDIKNSISGIKDSLIDIATDKKVVSSFKRMLESFALNAGKVAGSMVSVGTTIAQNLLGGINKYLKQNKNYIKDRLIGIMDAKSEVANLIGEYAVAFADIFSIFGGTNAQQVTANIIGMFSNGFLGALELVNKFGRDVIMCITQPIVENKDAIKLALENSFSTLSSLTGTVRQAVTDLCTEAIAVYDEYIGPSMVRVKDGISQVFGSMLDVYNTSIAPVLQNIAKGFNDLYNSNLKPMFDNILILGGKIAELASTLWKNILAPLLSWFVSSFGNQIASTLQTVWDVASGILTVLSDAINDITLALQGVCDFLTGVFSGDWQKCWQGIKELVDGANKFIYDVTLKPLQAIASWLADKFVGAWKTAYDGICKIFSVIGQWFNNTVITPLVSAFNTFKTTWIGIFQAAWKGICTAWQGASNWFSTTIITPIRAKFTEWKTSICTLATQAWTGVKTAWNNATSWFTNSIINPIKKGFSTAWDNIKQKGIGAFNGIKDGCRSAVNGIIGHINGLIGKINSIGFDMPDTLGGGHVGFNIPKVPMLARGGIVDQPTLAMVGEAGKEAVVPLENNTEWVAKVAGLIASALLPFMQGGNSGGDTNRDIVFSLDGVELVRAFLPTLIKEANRQGVTIGG